MTIPFGDTLTYNDISKIIVGKRKIKRMSSQAVLQDVGRILFVLLFLVIGL